MVCRLVIDAKIRSISMSLRTSLMIGTKESGTAVKEETALPATFSKTVGYKSKKSSRLTCLGATARVSISEPTHRQSFEHGMRLDVEPYQGRTLQGDNFRTPGPCRQTGQSGSRAGLASD